MLDPVEKYHYQIILKLQIFTFKYNKEEQYIWLYIQNQKQDIYPNLLNPGILSVYGSDWTRFES